MNRLKSIFISAYMSTVFVITLLSLHRIGVDGYTSGWAGAALAAGPPAAFFAYIMANLVIKSLARTTSGLPLVTIGSAAGAALSLFGYIQGENATDASFACALTAFGGWVAYNNWYSHYGKPPVDCLAVGTKLPTFDLENEDGTVLSSDAFRGKPTLMIFYRGNWCPFCMSQIKEVADRYRELSKNGTRIVLVSPQPHKFTKNLAKRYKVPFTFLVDPKNRAAKLLNIAGMAGLPAGLELFGYDSDTVIPTALITDSDGTIIFADLADNYRIRPEPDAFLRVLEENAGRQD